MESLLAAIFVKIVSLLRQKWLCDTTHVKKLEAVFEPRQYNVMQARV
jgi:hypothetical protein